MSGKASSVGVRLGTLVSVRTGRVREHERPAWDQRRAKTFETAYWKEERQGPVRIGTLGLEGDEQADRRGHGGPEMAVLMYAARHYADWRRLPGLEGMGPGGFAENLTLDGADETRVCVGDVLDVGGARLQIASPRGPCANISRRWDAEWLLKRARETRHTGWYLRVLKEGVVASGDEVRLIERPHDGWTIDRLLRLRFAVPGDAEGRREASGLEALAPEWRERYAKLAGGG